MFKLASRYTVSLFLFFLRRRSFSKCLPSINIHCGARLYELLSFVGVQAAAVNVICELARKNPKNYLSLAPLFFKLMTSSTNNWVLIKIIKLVSGIGRSIIITLKLGGPSSEAQQNKIVNHFQEPGTYSGRHPFKGPSTILGGKVILKRYVLGFLRNKAKLSQYFNVVGSSFQMSGAATEKARLPRFSFVLGIESCCEVDELSGYVRKVHETSQTWWLMNCKSAISKW